MLWLFLLAILSGQFSFLPPHSTTGQVPPPSVSIVADPPTGPIYESTSYLLTCTATVNTTIVNTPVTASVVWTDPSGNVIFTNDTRRQVTPPTGNSLVSMLLFQPIDIGHNDDRGTYTCQMIINSNNSLSQPGNSTIDVTVQSLPSLKINFTSVGSFEVGQNLTLTCTITTVERLVVTLSITFIKINQTDMEILSNLNRPYTITMDVTGSVTNYTLMLEPVTFEDGGMYTCMAEFNVTGYNNTDDPDTATYDSQEASDVFTLNVELPVIVTISKEHDDTFYAGIPFFIKCDIMLDSLITIPVNVTNQWTHNNTNVPIGSDATITVDLNMINTLYYNATLMFNPLDNADDTGIYACNVAVTVPNSNMYIRNLVANAVTSITVIGWADIASITADIPSDITFLPQMYVLHANIVGQKNNALLNNATWYYESRSTSTEMTDDLCSGQSGYNCSIGSGVLINQNNGSYNYSLAVTWNGETITSGVLSQSNNNGDHKYRFYLCYNNVIERNRYHIVTVPKSAPSTLTVATKTSDTITLYWIFDPSDADGYVVYVTNDTDTVQVVQVKGSSITLNGLKGGTTYKIRVRAYQQLVGPPSNTITVQTLPIILVSSVIQVSTRVDCLTPSNINPLTDVNWLVNGVMKNNFMYTSTDSITFNNSLLVYPDPLEVSVNVTCTAMIRGVNYSQSVTLHQPSSPPDNVRGFILNATNIKVNWTNSSVNNQYVIEYNYSGSVTSRVVSTREYELALTDLSPKSTYAIRVYSYENISSVNNTVATLKFDVPSPVSSLSVSSVSTTNISLSWFIPSIINYVTYYTISYVPSCFNLSSGNETVSVSPHQSTTTYSYTLIGLHSGVNYTITVIAGNVLGESNPISIKMETISSTPTGVPDSLTLIKPINNLTWDEPNCSKHNGLITGYTVLISNSSIAYNLTSTDRNIILNDLVFGTEYNVSVAALNSVGIGPFSDSIVVEIGIIPGPVRSLSSIMDSTWSVISWSVPSFIPQDYPIVTYEIGYLSDNCSTLTDDDFYNQTLNQYNLSSGSTITNITGLKHTSCYIFGVRAYTANGYGKWTIIANQTLKLLCQHKGIYLEYKETCYSNGSYFNDNEVNLVSDSLSCVLPNSSLSTGQWVRVGDPDDPVDCNNNSDSYPFQCTNVTIPYAIVSLYFPVGLSENQEGLYKCCLPADCTSTTNVIYANIFRWAEITGITVDIPSDITLLPQTYILHASIVGYKDHTFLNNATWYYVSGSANIEITASVCSGKSGYNCSIGNEVLLHQSNGSYDYNLTVTWNGETITSGVLSQSSNNGDHKYRFYLNYGDIDDYVERHKYHTVRVPKSAPSSLTVATKTSDTITLYWTPLDSSDADGYVVYVTNDTDTVQIVQVKRSNIILNGLRGGRTYKIRVRAYQQLVGPASSTITVQTLPIILVSSIIQVSTRVDCLTPSNINPLTDVNWLVNGVIKNNLMYTSTDSITYTNTLLVYPHPLEVSVNVTCTVMIRGVNYSQSVTLHQPSSPPDNVRGFILNATNIKVNWTNSSVNNQYVIEYNYSGSVTSRVVSTREYELALTDLSPKSTYTIRVYSYENISSVNNTVATLKFDVPSPVSSLSASSVSTTNITLSWFIPSIINYVTYYTISYVPSCFNLSSGNETVSVSPHQSTTTYSYTLIGLHSGVNYTITVIAGNVLGGSNPISIKMETISSTPTGVPDSLTLIKPINKLTWDEPNCSKHNGLITGYTVLISNSSIAYNLTSTDRNIILNDLVFGTEYNVSVAALNSVGIGPFSDSIVVEIGIIPGPVTSLSSIMDSTWSVISWRVPSFIPQDYPIVTYEIGYLSDNCSTLTDDDFYNQTLNQYNLSSGSTITNITGLKHTSCYIFGVRAYTVNGYGKWTIITNNTLPHQTSAVETSEAVETPESVETSQPVKTSGPSQTSEAAGNIKSDENASALFGASLAASGFIIMILVLVIVVILLKKKSSSTGKHHIKESISEIQENQASTSLVNETEIESVISYLTIISFVPQIPHTLSVSLDKLATHIATCYDSNAFEEQFQNLYDEEKPCDVGNSEENKAFNRLKNITVYDDNRIVLTPISNLECQREYINANYVDGYSSSKKFITTQGPIKETLVDFWHLIWQERPVSIVMLTKLKEGGKSKCRQYWPNTTSEPKEFGPFIVMLQNAHTYPDLVIRKLSITIQNESYDSHTLIQYHLTSWPDQGVPDYATSFMSLYRRVMSSWSLSKGTILVHCSAGVGRTGIFIAMDIALEQARKEGVVDIAGIVNRLRQQRMKMVQSLDQYVFLHDALLEAIICGETEIPIGNYTLAVQALKKNNPRTNCTQMEVQYNLLYQLTPNPNDVDCNSATAHTNKNRSNKYLPPDKFIVALKETNGYINASYLNSYLGKNAFIIAQSPMENTVRDFWKMIVDCKVSVIVMLCGEEDCCYQYWIDSMTYNEFFVKVNSERNANGYIERKIKVSFNKESRSVLQLQVTDWPQDGVVMEPSTILKVIDEVRDGQKSAKKGPVVVHCSDTVSRSGVYCSTSIALEQCKAEDVVDVFQVTKAVRRSKPGAITTLEQYISIYDVVDLYLQTTYVQ